MRRLLFLLPLVLGCASKAPAEVKQAGELGGYVFTYRCSDASDAFCDEGATGFPSNAFPTIAVGGSFRATFNIGKQNGKDTPDYQVGIAAGEGDRIELKRRPTADGKSEDVILTAKKAGFVALLATTGYDVGDLLHVKFAKADRIEASGSASVSGGTITATAGGVTVGLSSASGTVTLRAFPVLKDGTPLAGAMPTKWSQATTDVLAIQPPAASEKGDNIAKFDIKAFGTAVIHVEMGDVAADLTVKLEAK